MCHLMPNTQFANRWALYQTKMSVERDIEIKILTNDCFPELLDKFVDKNWRSNNRTLNIEDIDDFDFKETKDFEDLKSILTQRESKGLMNYVLLTVFDYETVTLSAQRLTHNYDDYQYQYELNFRLGIGRRIQTADRYTDFSFYLKDLLPKLKKIGCYINEMNCRDFES